MDRYIHEPRTCIAPRSRLCATRIFIDVIVRNPIDRLRRLGLALLLQISRKLVNKRVPLSNLTIEIGISNNID